MLPVERTYAGIFKSPNLQISPHISPLKIISRKGIGRFHAEFSLSIRKNSFYSKYTIFGFSLLVLKLKFEVLCYIKIKQRFLNKKQNKKLFILFMSGYCKKD